jgi:3-oxoacyl-[acyl-carrier-protein] synthase-3
MNVTGRTVSARERASHVSKIVASAHAYPSALVDNDAYLERCEFHPTADWHDVLESSRIKTRRWCLPGESTRTMTEALVDRLLASQPSLASELDLVVVASGTTMPIAHPSDPDNASFADLAPLILKRLGVTTAVGLDIKACYCTGFLRGMQVVDSMLANPNYRTALLVATEQGSRFATAASNRSSFCSLVGDAAGAVLFRRAPTDSDAGGSAGVVDYCGYSDVAKLDWVGIGQDAASILMLGSRAAEATREMLIECGQLLLRRNQWTPAEVDWFLPIQSHGGLIDSVREALEFPPEKLLWFGDTNGFSGSASIPSCLSEQIERGVVRPGQRVLSVAVGAGMNCAGALYYA